MTGYGPLPDGLHHIGPYLIAASRLKNFASGLRPLLLKLAHRNAGALEFHDFRSTAWGQAEQEADRDKSTTFEEHRNLPGKTDAWITFQLRSGFEAGVQGGEREGSLGTFTPRRGDLSTAPLSLVVSERLDVRSYASEGPKAPCSHLRG